MIARIIYLLLVVFAVLLAAYAHEAHLIKDCLEEGTLHTLNDEYTFECKATKKDEN